MYEAIGDREASRVIGNCIRLMTEATRLHEGRPVQTIGDELLATFSTPEAGVLAASDMMCRIDQEPKVAGQRLALRIGFHHGSVLMENSSLVGGQIDIFGDTVNTAARIAGLAKARQILTSETALERLPPRWRAVSRPLDVFSLKGKSDDIRIYEVLWQKPEDVTLVSTAVPPGGGGPLNQLVIYHMDRRIVLDMHSSGLTMGREPTNQLVIDDLRVSRQHARIERRRDKFVLIDQSTNGTYVNFEGQAEFLLHMEEVVLYGRGHISPGRSCHNNGTAGLLKFQVH